VKNVIAIKMVGTEHLEHIDKLRWVEVDKPGGPARTAPQDWTRAQMYNFVVNNPRNAFAISRTDNKYAFLEPVNGLHVQYVRTMPDSTRKDNLLSLPRFN